MKIKWICPLCKKSYGTHQKAELCCLKKKRELGIEDPNKSLAEIRKLIKSRRQVMILDAKKLGIKKLKKVMK